MVKLLSIVVNLLLMSLELSSATLSQARWDQVQELLQVVKKTDPKVMVEPGTNEKGTHTVLPFQVGDEAKPRLLSGRYTNTTRTTKDQAYLYMWKYVFAFSKWVPTNQYLHENYQAHLAKSIDWKAMDLSRFGFIGTDEQCYWGLIAVHWLKPLPVAQELSSIKKEQSEPKPTPKVTPPPQIISIANQKHTFEDEELHDLKATTTMPYHPKSIVVDANWKENGDAPTGSSIWLALHRDGKEVTKVNIFGTFDAARDQTIKVFTEADPIVMLSKAGDMYKLYAKTAANGNELHIKTTTVIVKAVA